MANPTSTSKGQGVSLDFMAGVFIFILAITYFVVIWNLFSVAYANHVTDIDDELSAISTAERLVSSSGSPANWSLSPLTAQSAGLAQRPNELDWYRIWALNSLNYTSQKQLLGIDRDFLIKIETPDGIRLATMGRLPGNVSAASEVTRLAMLNGTLVALRVQTYGNYSR